MSDFQPAPEGRDPVLWAIAKRRAGFKRHAATYLIINAFFWGTWYFTGGRFDQIEYRYPWPIWTTLGWGVGLAFHFAGAYVFPGADATEREYSRLKNNSKN